MRALLALIVLLGYAAWGLSMNLGQNVLLYHLGFLFIIIPLCRWIGGDIGRGL